MKEKALIVFLILTAFVTIGIGLFIGFRPGLYIGDEFYHKKALGLVNVTADKIIIQRDNVFIFQNESDEQQTISVIGVHPGDFSDIYVDLQLQNAAIIHCRWNGDIVFVDSRPFYYGKTKGQKCFEDEMISQAAFVEVVCRIVAKDWDKRGNVGIMILGVVWYMLGCIAVYKPKQILGFFLKWMYGEERLSKKGCIAQRISGVVQIICSIIFITNLYVFW